MRLALGTVVVLEGIDATGKSTQMELLQAQFPDEVFVHQPSGNTIVGELVYQLTESKQRLHPVTRQFLHLAAHAEQYDRVIIPALSERGVFMDRNWWSTLAYGWYTGGLKWLVDLDVFEEIVRLPTQGIMPDVVFIFLHEHERDSHNTVALVDAYADLAGRYPEVIEPIEIGTKQEVNGQIVRALERRKLVR